MKKFFAFLALMLMLAFSSKATSNPQDEGQASYKASNSVKGDLNDDGRVSIDDATTLIDYLLKGTWPDPHETGYWLVMIHADGTEEYVPLWQGMNGDYVTAYDVVYPLFYQIARFYFVINGVAYGAEVDCTWAELSNASMNPLITGKNYYYVECGYSYTFGVHLILDNETAELMGYNAYVAKAGPVGKTSEANNPQDEGRTAYKASSSVKGDLNDDGRVSIDDVTTLIDYLLKGTWPENPHMTGYWLVMIHSDGTEEYVPLHVNINASWSTTFNVIEPSFHNISKFYYVIDGVKYYASEDAYYNNDPEHYVPDMIEAYLGQPQYNPLTPASSKPYFVECGYSYEMGVLPFLNLDYEIAGYNAIVVRYAPAQP